MKVGEENKAIGKWWQASPAKPAKKKEDKKPTGWRGDTGRAPRTVMSPTVAPTGWAGDTGQVPRPVVLTAPTTSTGWQGDYGVQKSREEKPKEKDTFTPMEMGTIPWWQVNVPAAGGWIGDTGQTPRPGPMVVNPNSMAPGSIALAPRSAAPGWVGDLGYAPRFEQGRPWVGDLGWSRVPKPRGWIGDLGYGPRPTVSPWTNKSTATGGFGTSYDWSRRGGGGGGGGYGGYSPSWMLALNQWNYGE